jgi:hypothetical protein
MTVNGLGRPRLVSYERLSTLYLEALESGLPPITTIARVLEISHKAANRRVDRARYHGYLPPGDPLTGRGTPDPGHGMLRIAAQQEAAQIAAVQAIRVPATQQARQARHAADRTRRDQYVQKLRQQRHERQQRAEKLQQRAQERQYRLLWRPQRARPVPQTVDQSEPVLDVFLGDWL